MIALRKKEERIGVIVSSLKTSKSKELVEIQKLALASWQRYGNKVILLNKRTDLEGYNLSNAELIAPAGHDIFLKTALLAMGKNQNDTAALVQPNVILTEATPKLFSVHRKHQLSRAWAMTARPKAYTLGEVVDNAQIQEGEPSLDVFVGTGVIWAYAAKEIENLTIFDDSDWSNRLNEYLKMRLLGNRYYDGVKLGIALKVLSKTKKQESRKDMPVAVLPKTQYAA